jgi:hypothetical protein
VSAPSAPSASSASSARPAPAEKPARAAVDTPAPKAPGKKPALGAFKPAPKPEAGDGPPEAPVMKTAPSAQPVVAEAAPVDDVVLDLDDVIVAWNAVLEAIPRSLRSAIQEAQPIAVEGNVIIFGVSRTQMDNVKPRFQKEAHAIREQFIAQLGSPPKFKFTVHTWTGTADGGRPRAPRVGSTLEAVPGDADASDPGPEAPPEADVVIDLVDMADVVDAPKGAGAAVDSISRLADAFGATVVEEVPRT